MEENSNELKIVEVLTLSNILSHQNIVLFLSANEIHTMQ